MQILKSKYFIVFLLFTFFVSCSHDCQYFFEDIDYITEIKDVVTFKEKDKDALKIDYPGLYDIRFMNNDMLIARHVDGGIISVLDKQDYSVSSSFLNKGRGPNEILSPCFLSLCSIFKGSFTVPDGERIISFEYDSAKVNRAVINVDACYLEFRPTTFFQINDSCYFIRKWSDDLTHVERFVKEKDKMSAPGWLDPLNGVNISTKYSAFDFNLVGSVLAYEPTRQMVVEACVYLNAINIYSLDGTFRKTVCLGKRLNNIQRLETMDILNMENSFVMARAYANGFSCFHAKDNRIYNFDWDGKLLFCIDLPDHISTFDYDREYLYTLDRNEESLVRFKMPVGYTFMTKE